MRLFSLFVILCTLSESPLWAAQAPRQHQKVAQTALQNQMSPEGKECLNARSTAEENDRVATSGDMIEHDFDVFYANLLSLLKPEPANQQKLDEAQAQWKMYRDKTCEVSAISTVAGASNLQQLPDYTPSRDLDTIYHSVLHN